MADPEPASVTYELIGVVRSSHTRLEGMPLQSVAAKGSRGQVEVRPGHEAALKDLDGFSHVWIVSHLHRSEPPTSPVVLPFLDDVERGLFATRSPRHPNPIGLSVVRLLSIEGATLEVDGLDLLDGTPVLDLKPYVPLFDCIDAERTGWLAEKAETVHSVRSDRRFELPATEDELLFVLNDPRAATAEPPAGRPRVRDVMYSDPKTLPRDGTVGEVRALFRNQWVRVALLVHHGTCTGTIGRGDIPAASRDEDSAGWLARTPQTIHADASVAEAHSRLDLTGDGRLVVVDDRGKLAGLLCHNHAGNGFCNHNSPCVGTKDAPPTRWTIIRTSGPAEHRRGLLLAPAGRSLSIGDTLKLPPDTRARWVVIGVTEDPGDADAGIAAVEALSM